MICLSLLIALLASCQESTSPAAPATAPAGVAASQPAAASDPIAAPRGEITSADQLLDQLETAADGIRDFKADVFYEKFDAVAERSELRTGEVVYQTTGAADRRFAIIFNALYSGDRKDDTAKEHYVFSGRSMAEYDHARKQFTKREIVPPGKTFDPLKLGEGPFPLPVGQPKSEVLSRYSAELISPPGAEAPKQLQIMRERYPDCIGLRLTPRPGTKEVEATSVVDVYYDRATLLPVGVNMVGTGAPGEQDRKTVRLAKVNRNGGLSAEDLEKLKMEPPDPRVWTIDSRGWEG
jgi:hypothetical protein